MYLKKSLQSSLKIGQMQQTWSCSKDGGDPPGRLEEVGDHGRGENHRLSLDHVEHKGEDDSDDEQHRAAEYHRLDTHPDWWLPDSEEMRQIVKKSKTSES